MVTQFRAVWTYNATIQPYSHAIYVLRKSRDLTQILHNYNGPYAIDFATAIAFDQNPSC